MIQSKVVLLTGSSRGIGREIAIECAKRGHRVWATMRNPIQSQGFEDLPAEIRERIEVRVLDVTKQDLIELVIQEMIDLEGKIDVLINNAGYGVYGPVELVSQEEIAKQFEVNLYGPVRLMQSVLPYMRAQNRGHIINMSSIGGVVSNPFLGVYCATKHALEAVSASLASSVFQWNINVSLVEPGVVSTGFADSMVEAEELQKENPYRELANRYKKQLSEKIKTGQDPREVAQVVCDIMEDPNPKLRYQSSQRVEGIVSEFIKDPTGDDWLNSQKKLFDQD